MWPFENLRKKAEIVIEIKKSKEKEEIQKKERKPRKKIKKEKKLHTHKKKNQVQRAEKQIEENTSSQYVYRSIEREASASLPVDEYIPSHLNKDAVKAIILWGFLRPGEVKLFFGGHYLHYEAVRRMVLRKGTKPQDFNPAFQWLMKGGVVLKAKKGNSGRFLCSLNPDPHSIESPFQEILKIVINSAASQRR